jgi:GT2 family glycosyltransferase
LNPCRYRTTENDQHHCQLVTIATGAAARLVDEPTCKRCQDDIAPHNGVSRVVGGFCYVAGVKMKDDPKKGAEIKQRFEWAVAKPAPPELRNDCIYLGERIRLGRDSKGAPRACAACEVYDCGLHGKCTRGGNVEGLRSCMSCKDYLKIVEEIEPPTPAPAATVHPKSAFFAPPSVKEFGVGITTAPRPEYTLAKSTASIVAAGFTSPIIGIEPNSETRRLPGGCELIQRKERLGAWRNFRQTMRDVLTLRPNADAIVMFQDDVVLADHAADFLRHDLWPSPKIGVVSIYGPTVYEHKVHGCRPIIGRFLVGACALVFPRAVAESMLKHPKLQDWRGAPKRIEPDPAKKKAIDTFIGHAMHLMGKRVCYYTPSLAQHFAKRSALGHGDNTGNRRSHLFVGGSAFDLFKPEPIRWTANGSPRHARPNGASTQRRCAAVIPHCDTHGKLSDMLIRVLRRLWTHDQESVGEIIIVDNGSGPKALAAVRKAVKELATIPTRIIELGQNYGFSKAVNRGFEEVVHGVGNLDVLLLNNDAFPLPGCLPTLARHASGPRVGMVGPLSTDGGHQSIHRASRRNGWTAEQKGWYRSSKKPDLPTGAKLLANSGRISDERMLAFFCTWIRRDCIQEIGMHREDSAFAAGLGGDDEYCHRARKAGWRVRLAHDALCEHWHKTSFRALKIDRAALQAKAVSQMRAEGII